MKGVSKQGGVTKQEFWNAAGVEGKLEVVRKGIEEEGFPVDLRDPSENDTALIKAAYWARYEICEYLLSKGADINAVDNSMGFTGFLFSFIVFFYCFLLLFSFIVFFYCFLLLFSFIVFFIFLCKSKS
jgi:hypothetical protein